MEGSAATLLKNTNLVLDGYTELQSSYEVLVQGDKWTITSTAADPSTNQNILKEVATLGANGLPIELVQYEASGVLAKHVVYPDVQVDVDIPASTWQI